MCVWFFFCDFRSLLSEDELKQLVEACDMALELNQSKHRIYEYVESRMSFIAPNLSVIVGASTAAKLMGEHLGFSEARRVRRGVRRGLPRAETVLLPALQGLPVA